MIASLSSQVLLKVRAEMSDEHFWVSGKSGLYRARLILATRRALWCGKEEAKSRLEKLT